jgi:hypothetical protein
VQAGILEDRPGDSGVRSALLTDPQLTERQKQVLIEIYESFTKESQKPPTAEVVAITRDQSTPAETGTPAETVDAAWTDATGTAADTATDSAAADAAPSEPSKTDGPGGSI